MVYLYRIGKDGKLFEQIGVIYKSERCQGLYRFQNIHRGKETKNYLCGEVGEVYNRSVWLQHPNIDLARKLFVEDIMRKISEHRKKEDELYNKLKALLIQK